MPDIDQDTDDPDYQDRLAYEAGATSINPSPEPSEASELDPQGQSVMPQQNIFCDQGIGNGYSVYHDWSRVGEETPGTSCVDGAGNQYTVPPGPTRSPGDPDPVPAPTPYVPPYDGPTVRATTDEDRAQFEAQDKLRKERENCETLPYEAKEQCERIYGSGRPGGFDDDPRTGLDENGLSAD